jgi:hypothetical protein
VKVSRCDTIHARGIVSHLIFRHDSLVETGDVVVSPERWMAPIGAFCLGKETISGSEKLLSRATIENKTIAKVPYRMDLS